MTRKIVLAVLYLASSYLLLTGAGWRVLAGVWIFAWAMNVENDEWPFSR